MKVTEQIHALIWRSASSNNCNAYLLADQARILIDPGHVQHFRYVQTGLDALGLSIEDMDLVLCTHAHADHLEAVQLFSEAGVPFAVHEAEAQVVESMARQLSDRRRQATGSLVPAFYLTEGELEVKGLDLEIIHTPGHSPGSVSIYWPSQKALFSGDLIFRDGVGRTDLPRGDGQQLKESIKRVAERRTDYLLSGHGDMVSGQDDVRSNFERVEEYWFPYV